MTGRAGVPASTCAHAHGEAGTSFGRCDLIARGIIPCAAAADGQETPGGLPSVLVDGSFGIDIF